jgi:hypothetical protein
MNQWIILGLNDFTLSSTEVTVKYFVQFARSLRIGLVQGTKS